MSKQGTIYYDQLAEDISLLSGGIPDIAIRQILPMCVQRYATESTCFTEVVMGHIKNGVFVTADGCRQSGIPIDGRFEVISIERVSYKQGVIPLVSRKASLDVIGPSATLHTNESGCVGVKFTGLDDTDEDVVTVVYYVTPKRDAESCPAPRDTGLFTRAVTALCMYYLYMMPNRDWSDPQLASHNLFTYESLVVEGKRKAKNNDTPNVRECAFSW